MGQEPQPRDFASLIQGHNPSPEEWLQIMHIAPDEAVAWEAARRNMLGQRAGETAVAASTQIQSQDTNKETKEDPKQGIEKLPFSDQLGGAYAGYKNMMADLNQARAQAGTGESSQIAVADEDTFAVNFRAWVSGEEQNLQALAANGSERVDLVAVPNTALDSDDVIDLTRALGRNLRARTVVDEELVRTYSASELSGQVRTGLEKNDFTFVVVSRDLTPQVEQVQGAQIGIISMEGTVQEQRRALAFLQQENPGVQLPSVADAISWLYKQGTQGRLGIGPSLPAQTTTCHFDLPEHRTRSNKERAVLTTGLAADGTVQIVGTNTKTRNVTRLARA